MAEYKCKIEHMAHACFKITYKNYVIITDPYDNGSVPGLLSLDESASLVLSSHEHSDHNASHMIKITAGADCPFKISTIHTYHDDKKGALRGENIIHVLENDDMKIVHMGDIGCDLKPDQLEALKGADILLIPVGGFFTIDAQKAWEMTKSISPKIVIPMHYKGEGYGYDAISDVNEFIGLSDNVQYMTSLIFDPCDGEFSDKNGEIVTAVLDQKYIPR